MGKMVISIESYGEKHSVEMSDEANADRVMRAFVDIADATGYSRQNFIDMLKDGDPKNWDTSWQCSWSFEE